MAMWMVTFRSEPGNAEPHHVFRFRSGESVLYSLECVVRKDLRWAVVWTRHLARVAWSALLLLRSNVAERVHEVANGAVG